MLGDRVKLGLFLYRMRGGRQYQLAHKCGLLPNTLSSMLHGAITPSRDDARIQRLADELGLSIDEFFQPDDGPAV